MTSCNQDELWRISGLSFALGVASIIGLFGYQRSAEPIWGYLTTLAVFHFLEFFQTALFNPVDASTSSFLLNHSWEYTMSIFISSAEWLLRRFWLGPANGVYVKVGVLIVLMGQVIRSMAMYYATTNFSHLIADYRRPGHVLVQSGIYARMRHPAYAGFYWWAIGSQVMLSNFFSFFVFLIVLHRFFTERIEFSIFLDIR